ncbi:YkgJ family cysteine cluster protein [Acinetobacter haemolyticus]|uniref:YkgJ family cysteine cluster protein n=1 Tax=Acinetobacter haemolyticus TaxID=29430 RepID=UPI000E57675C|nr:YkgJ family cysteine cluster protein [Acinetobacter haemolyticus]NAR49377.1 YkgJ family cysteine cluster protein [Acinetobacter haemolyticus]NAR56480.1 YkgJ family cysteine cluster protein [Acinetobacter haemolyticus]NAR79311.1 YkgJ family cysteine cluster protein [Acinetobacter haemolyticus]NAR89070.1 YkgJ family cysteine cluster protein [Acinetobacter haemolyticus]NAR96817.1 YkgJ family cysteine cluster protein [Acinetobacter haemolyticus]
MSTFPCVQCGACCRHVDLSGLTAYLDRGDGVCRHYDQDSHLCTIYDTRPDICRVDTYYEKNFKEILPWTEFVDLNLIACKQLSELDNK